MVQEREKNERKERRKEREREEGVEEKEQSRRREEERKKGTKCKRADERTLGENNTRLSSVLSVLRLSPHSFMQNPLSGPPSSSSSSLHPLCLSNPPRLFVYF